MFLQKGGCWANAPHRRWQVDLGLYEQALIEAAGLRTPDFLGTFGVEDQNLDGFTMVNPYKSLLIPIQNMEHARPSIIFGGFTGSLKEFRSGKVASNPFLGHL